MWRGGGRGSFIGPGSSKTRTKHTPFMVVLALIYPRHRSVVAAKPFCAKNAAVSMRQTSLVVVPRKFPLYSTNSYPVVQAVGLSVLVKSSRPVVQYLMAKKLDVYFPLPVRSRETRPVRLVHHFDYASSIANRSMSCDLLPLKALKKSRNVVLSELVRRGFVGEIAEHILLQSRWKYVGVSPWSWGL